jgi:hypothetical protein
MAGISETFAMQESKFKLGRELGTKGESSQLYPEMTT